jgi:hypothetical protein
MRLFVVVILLVADTCVFAQEIFSPGKKIHLIGKSIPSHLKTDGKLDEPEWNQAQAISAFVQVEPFQGKASDHRTEVKVLYNSHYLYVGVYCGEPSGVNGLRVPDLKRDFNWRAHDTFAISFDGFNDERNSISIVTNPYGAQKDYLSFDATYFDSDWNGLWSVRTTRTDSSWTAEFQIPWKTLRYPESKKDFQSWGVNFLRLRRLTNEISVWSPYPRSFSFNRMEYAGILDSLAAPPPSANIQFTPYFLTTANRKENSPDKSVNEEHLKFGGELKWAMNANTILDLTANTDFAQADADVHVNNISRFSVLFPERRPFFLENASLFGAGLTPGDGVGGRMTILPFFSRQIGLVNGMPVPIDAGARFVHRASSHNYGALLMRQRESENTPLTHFFTGRFSQNIGSQNRVGSLLTMKAVDQTDSTAAYLNTTAVLDGFFRLTKAHSLNGMIMTSSTSNEGAGYSGFMQYLFTSNKFQGWWTQSLITDNFNPEAGFLSRKNVIATTPGLTSNLRGSWLPLQKIIRAFKPGVAAEFYHQASSKILIEREIKITPVSFELQSGGYAAFSVASLHHHLLNAFSPLEIPISSGTYSFVRNTLSVGSDASREISYAAQYEWGEYFNGKLATSDLSINVAPIPHVAIKTSVNINQFQKVGESLISPTVKLYTLEGRFALNPRIQLIGLCQKNSQYESAVYNFRFAWEYKPLSYIYVVYNNRSYDVMEERHHEQTAIVKVTFLKQF